MAAPFYNHYDALGIKQGATKTEIRLAYKKAVLRYHPDKNPADPKKHTAQFRAVQEAWEVLNDAYKKSNYDAIHSHQPNHPGRAFATAKGPSQRQSQRAPPRAPRPAAAQSSENTHPSAPSPEPSSNYHKPTPKEGYFSGPKSHPTPDTTSSGSYQYTANSGSYQHTGASSGFHSSRSSFSYEFPSSSSEPPGPGYEFEFHSAFEKSAEETSWKPSPNVPPFEFRSNPWGTSGSTPRKQPSRSKAPGSRPAPESFGFPGIPSRFFESAFKPFADKKKPDLPKPKASRQPPRNCIMMECTVFTTELHTHISKKKTFNMAPFGMYECMLYSPHGPGNSAQQSYYIPVDLKEGGWYEFEQVGNPQGQKLEMHIGDVVIHFFMVSNCFCKDFRGDCLCNFSVHGHSMAFVLQEYH